MLAFTPIAATRSQLALVWGIETFIVPMARHTDQMALQVDKELLDSGRCEEGDRVVIVAGSPPGIPGSTNALRVHRIGDAEEQGGPGLRGLRGLLSRLGLGMLLARSPGGSAPAGVVEWQTRGTQNALAARLCGFESRSRHRRRRRPEEATATG